MSKRGKQKKAENVEKRRLQMEEALECVAVKQAVQSQMEEPVKRAPKQCTFRHCQRYVDPSCTVCPYCGTVLEPQDEVVASLFPRPALQGC